MSDGDTDDEIIDPTDLNAETLQAVMTMVSGFLETHPSTPPAKMESDYREGRHDAFSAVMAVLSQWLDEIEEERPIDEELSREYRGNAHDNDSE
jgi:hypothetical protein